MPTLTIRLESLQATTSINGLTVNTASMEGFSQTARSVAPQLRETLEKLDARFEFANRHDLAPLINWSATRDAPIHRWLRYREAYSPELIDALGLEGRTLDPFCGAGSILVGAAMRGREAVGIDLNPLATFAAKVKTSPLSHHELELIKALLEQFPGNVPATVSPWLPELSIARKVFEPEILQAILRLRSFISDCGLSPNSRDFLHLAWVGVLEVVGSYFKEGNGIKYRSKQRRPGKYVPREEGAWQLKRFGKDQTHFVFKSYADHVGKMLDDTTYWNSAWGSASLIEGNALDLAELAPGQFNSIVFSPPYANRFDYFESMKVELWFGGFVESSDHMRQLRKSSLRSHLSSDFARPIEHFCELERLIECMDQSSSSWRMGVADLMRGYFSDIVHVLRQCREKLSSGSCYIVVGNSAFAGSIFPSDSLTALAGQRAGFNRAEIWTARHLTVAPQQRARLSGFEEFMRESIVVLGD